MINIAIDGPGGAGKSTVAKALAKRLKILYLDTGAMYRAAALKAVNTNTDVNDAEAVARLAETLDIEITYDKGGQIVFLDGDDVTESIREHHISALASTISAVPALRLRLVKLQRDTAEQFDCVLDGRDIGTFVLPDATLKIYLTAAPEVRAVRRLGELVARGQKTNFETVLNDLIARDKNDMSREFAPLKIADDAIVIDSTQLSVEQVVERIFGLLKMKKYEKGGR